MPPFCCPIFTCGLTASVPPAQLDVRFNRLGAESEAAIKEAVSGKTGFELKI